MCAVIGAVIPDFKDKHADLIKRVFFESRIRGMHATGVSYIKNNEIHTDKLPVPATEFAFRFGDYINEDGNLYLIGHCRYSTSDLEYNQPINTTEKSIVHNGVITQELPENWEHLYGYTCMTKNDSELVLHSNDTLREFPNMSMAVCELYNDKRLRFYRNGKRPIYFTTLEEGYIITSTADIAIRAGLENPVEVPMNTYMTIHDDLAIMIEHVKLDNVDLQKVNYELSER